MKNINLGHQLLLKSFFDKSNFKNNLFLKLGRKIVIFLNLSNLSERLPIFFRCDSTSISFLVISFHQIPLTWWNAYSYPYSVTESETDKPASTWTHWPDIACTPKNVISIGRVRLSHVSLRMNAATMEGSRNLLIVFSLMFSAYVVYGQEIRDRDQKICKLCLL